MNNFWQIKEWIELKTGKMTTEKLLSRTEYLKQVGYANYTDAKYREYLEAMKEKFEKTKNEDHI